MIKNDDNDHSSGGHLDMPFLVPLLDLTMILLFFFIIMSNAAQNVFDIKLPSADKEYKKDYIPLEDEKKVLKIYIKNNEFIIDETSFNDIDNFKNSVKLYIDERMRNNTQAKDIKVTVSSSKDVDVQKFLQVMTFLKSTGLEKVDILMDSK